MHDSALSASTASESFGSCCSDAVIAGAELTASGKPSEDCVYAFEVKGASYTCNANNHLGGSGRNEDSGF